jgi:predicted transcriptional regulator
MGAKSIRTYLDANLKRQVAEVAAAQGRSESAFIADAVRARLAAMDEGVAEAERESLRRQGNRIEARLDKLIWEQAQTKECLLLFVRVWLEHEPPLDPEDEDSAAASAEARFSRFLDLVMHGLTGGDRLGDLETHAGASSDGEANRNGAEAIP